MRVFATPEDENHPQLIDVQASGHWYNGINPTGGNWQEAVQGGWLGGGTGGNGLTRLCLGDCAGSTAPAGTIKNFRIDNYRFDPQAWERLDEEQQRAFEELDERYHALDRESEAYWDDRRREDINRQREEMGNRLAEFEAEAERRRSEEGEHFDEEWYEFERGMIERRLELDERRIAIEEDFDRKRKELGNSPRGQDQRAWERLDEEQQSAFEELDEQHQVLDREHEEFWDARHEDHEDHEED